MPAMKEVYIWLPAAAAAAASATAAAGTVAALCVSSLSVLLAAEVEADGFVDFFSIR